MTTDTRIPVDISDLNQDNQRAVARRCYLELLNAGGEDGDWWEITSEFAARQDFYGVLDDYFRLVRG